MALSTKYGFFNSPLNNFKNMLLIGNSPNVKDKELGQYINQNNFNIIRFNQQPTKNYEQYIGSHTTYRVVNGITWVSNNHKIPEDNIIVAEPPYTRMFGDIQKIKEKRKFKSVQLLPDYTKNHTTIFPTSGLMAIAFFLQFYEHIYIYGFSYDGTHFFEKNEGDKHHNYKCEKDIITSLISQGKIIYLTKEHAMSPTPLKINPMEHNNTNTNIDTSVPINILSIKHANNNNGKYFHFDGENINLNKGQTIYASATHAKNKLNVVLWGYPNGSDKGDSHGKTFDKHYNKFCPNDTIIINEIYPIIKVLSTNHEKGNKCIGMYFHFDGNVIAHINDLFINNKQNELLDEDANTNTDTNVKKERIKVKLMIYNSRKNNVQPVVVWNFNNGGSVGNSHGRYLK